MTCQELKENCIQNKIPYLNNDTLAFIKKLIIDNKYHTILEIGTAYGYSAQCFSEIEVIDKILTIEKDSARYKKACAFLSNNKKISIVNEDAHAYKLDSLQVFDLIFIDGAKSHQELLVNKYLPLLKNNGKMVIDNIFLKKFNNKTLSKNQKKLVKKINIFREWLVSQTSFSLKIVDIGDGLAIISKLE